MVLYIIYIIIMIFPYESISPDTIFVVYGTEIIIGETLAKHTLKTIMILPPHRRVNNFLCGDQRHVTTIIITVCIFVFTLSLSVFGNTHTDTHVRASDPENVRLLFLFYC